MEYLTLPNITAFFVALAYLYSFLVWIAPKTATKIDDEAVAAVERAKSWGYSMSPFFWSIVEGMEKSGKIQKLNKPVEFLLQLRKAYQDAHGTDLPKPAEIVAQQIAAGLSAQAKLPNPPQAQPSQAPSALRVQS